MPAGSTVTLIEVRVIDFRSSISVADLFLESLQFFAQQIVFPVGTSLITFPNDIQTTAQTGVIAETPATWGLSADATVLGYGGVAAFLRNSECLLGLSVISETDPSLLTCFVDAVQMRLTYNPPARSGAIGGGVGRGIIL
jgi:hypothetical protein